MGRTALQIGSFNSMQA